MKEKIKMIGIYLWKNIGELLSIGVAVLSNFLITYGILIQEFQGWLGEEGHWLRYVIIALALLLTIVEVKAIISKRGMIHLSEIKEELDHRFQEKLKAMKEEDRSALLR